MVVDISTGPFNREIFDLYAQKATPVFQDARQDGPFVLLVIYKESMMMTNEAAEHFVRIAARMVAADIAPVAVAFVVTTDVEGGNLIPGILKTRVYDPFNVPFQVFSVRDDAEKWLNTKLTASSAK